MHYFQFNIKSYQAATAHLTNEEDLAYRRLLDHYYDTEQPIKAGANPVLCRRLRVGLPELEIVLSEFFELVDDCWKSEYCERLLSEYRTYTERQRTNGSKGGRGHKADAKPDKPTALPKKASAKPTTNQEPLTTNQEPNKKTSAANSFSASPFVDQFSEFWKAYPKKRAKDDAGKAFAKRKPDETLLKAMLDAIEIQSQSDDWLKESGKFIPYPATWLNDGRWMDADCAFISNHIPGAI